MCTWFRGFSNSISAVSPNLLSPSPPTTLLLPFKKQDPSMISLILSFPSVYLSSHMLIICRDLEGLRKLINEIPLDNKILLKCLCSLLRRASTFEKNSKMNANRYYLHTPLLPPPHSLPPLLFSLPSSFYYLYYLVVFR